MNQDFGNFVYKLLTSALDLKDRVDRSELLDFEVERNKLLNMIEEGKGPSAGRLPRRRRLFGRAVCADVLGGRAVHHSLPARLGG